MLTFAQAEGVEFEIFEAYSEEDIDDVYLCEADKKYNNHADVIKGKP